MILICFTVACSVMCTQPLHSVLRLLACPGPASSVTHILHPRLMPGADGVYFTFYHCSYCTIVDVK